MSSARATKLAAEIGAADAERDRTDEHGDEPVAVGLASVSPYVANATPSA